MFPHQDAWLDSGDRAYLAGGDVYLTGRVKDLIIRGGRNLYPYELEQAVSEIPGIRKGCVAVFASADPATGSANGWWWWLKLASRNRRRWLICVSKFRAPEWICWGRHRTTWSSHRRIRC